MIYLAQLDRAALYFVLARIDRSLAAEVRAGGCPRCGGPLHVAHYARKPRGGPPLPESLSVRHSLCCGHCRRRSTPPSVLFLGRKVYWGAVVVVVAALRQRRPGSASAAVLRRALDVSWKTVLRWMDWWAEAFPTSRTWRAFRGRLPPTVRDDDLPAALFDVVRDARSLVGTITAWARTEHACRGAPRLTQKMGRSQLMR